MSLFQFSQEEALVFFAVLTRFSILFSTLPFFGDRVIPTPVKVLLSLAVSVALFPALVRSGAVSIAEAKVWGSTAGGMIGTIACEALFALLMAFIARLSFDAIHFGANLVGNFMGFAAASTFDHHQESQTQVIAEIQTTAAMLFFLAIDGHHMMLRAALDSYRWFSLGHAIVGTALSADLVRVTGQVIADGIQLSAPVALSVFSVNVVFGMMGKALPQLNLYVMSFSATACVGLVVLWLSVPELGVAFAALTERSSTWMMTIARSAGR